MSKVKVLKFIPIDWVSFRKSKNFSTFENTIFPNIKTFYGAIFSAYFRKRGTKNAIKEIEKMIEEKLINLIGPFIVSERNEIYFRKPANLKLRKICKNENSCEYEYEYYKGFPCQDSFAVDDKNLRYIKYSNIDNLSEEGITFISISDLETFKKSSDKKLYLNLHKYNKNLPFSIERKVGIALDNKKRMVDKEHGAFYLLSTYRFRDGAGFGVFIDEKTEQFLNENKINTVNIGSKGKLARLEIFEIETDLFSKESSSKIKGLMLLTPAVFKNGFLPTSEYIRQKIVAVCNYKPEVYSGWDLKKNKPGKMFRIVPPGSVFFTEEKYLENLELTEEFNEYNYGKFIVLENCE
ncbi:cmr CRISPR-associated protein, Cmr3 family [Thermosipho africanus Ob7]|jgi:CRISPR-associated protein Cmr3|uniref:Cmr crispr-associated protein, Cmr3 family n=1 Tax=Thermosipho africanus (strain TCF52B) TaxID=484019 RepID=B7IFE8_THEAB|nr:MULTISPECIES: type III-B CRISPR module-associated protein Cmr3 [Thermosipho]ACJ74812.1 cmr crispr-associated protein, Cmr3 family [Thermosipho africanus TCF52B]MBZ4649366.1 cmr crispr-associated protein Cmr3 family [Thermosipho sp. (in: thermotogales)]RDI92678.1 cmr CRISPR-associated protein, Cmr3 family [Thermosipho africanus Ob7]